MMHELRYALRTLRRSPGFTLSAVVALAFGIGANTAVFSVVYAVLLKPLPYAEPDRLVRLYERNPGAAVERGGVSPGTFVDWRTRSRTLEHIALFTLGEALWDVGDTYEIVRSSAVSPALFSALRVTPVLGRTFPPETQQSPPLTNVGEVVISYNLWQHRFGGRTDVLGRIVRVEGRRALQIIGVMPKGFSFPEKADAWTSEVFLRPIAPNQRQVRYYHALARIRSGATSADARAELTAISSQLEIEQPRSNAGWTVRVEPLADSLVSVNKGALLALFGAVVGVLLIACANVANLLLARASARRHELAVRAALGAGTARLLRQSLADALVLATAGTLAGVALGNLITRVLIRFAPPEPRLEEAATNAPLLLFAIGAGLVTAVFVGSAPVLVTRAIEEAIRSRERTVAGGGRRMRRILIIGETAVVVLLLTAATLLVRSFVKLQGVDLGFERARVVLVEARWPVGRFTQVTRRPWFLLQQQVDQMLAIVRSVPGVEAAGMMTDVPLTGSPANGSMWLTGAPGASPSTPPASARDQWKADISIVTTGYFEAMGIPLLRGRRFTDDDRFTEAQLTSAAPTRPAGVAIINQAFAVRYFPRGDPIGQVVSIFDDQTFASSRAIVGVVADSRSHAVADAPEPAVFLPHGQTPSVFRPTIIVRATVPPARILPALSKRLRAFDPQLLVQRTRTMDEVVSGALSRPRFNLLLIGSFAVVALTLSAIGIYGVVAFVVTQRTREIGVRIALGARAANVVGLVLTDGLTPVITGTVVGLAAAALGTRALRTMLFGVTRLDLVSFSLSSVLLVTVATIACLVPAVRATRVDPIVALREE